MNYQNMKKCPTCGSLLYGRLVDAIQNPFMNESCPKAQKKVKSLTVKQSDYMTNEVKEE